jgi:hypothetical protein
MDAVLRHAVNIVKEAGFPFLLEKEGKVLVSPIL